MDIWYRGFLLVQEAEHEEEQGQYLQARNKLAEAKPIFDHLAREFPEYEPKLVRGRRHLIADKRAELQELLQERYDRGSASSSVSRDGTAGDSFAGEGGPAGTAIASPPVEAGTGRSSGEMKVDQGSREFALPSWEDGTSRALRRADRGGGEGGVRPSVGEVASSLRADLQRKDSLISWLNDENLKLRRELDRRKSRLERANAELARARANRQDLGRRIEAARQEGATGAQQKVEQLEELLQEATRQLKEATDRNERLVAELGESRDEIRKLRDRMAELERERDNLVEVVRGEGNGGKALKELMDRNRELTAQVDRAEELATSLSESNQEKDRDIELLESELSRIKSEREKLVAENLRHQQSIEDLQRKLELLSEGLTREEKNSLEEITPTEQRENELLRSIVLKQLRRQAQMKQAKELLLSQLDEVGARSETLRGLVEDMARGSQLSEEEKSLFKAPQFQEIVEAAMPGKESSERSTPASTPASASAAAAGDGKAAEGGDSSMSATLVAAGNGSGAAPADGVVEDQTIEVELSQLDKAARLDFKEGRYSEAEAGFLEFLRYRPRSVPCLCNLGVLKIALTNYSEAEYYLERALALDDTSGLAHYLLGRTYFLQEQFDEALASLEQGIQHEPRNAKAHNCVGVISSRKGWVQRAERAFTSAVSIDPKYGDAHFNLAVLHATRDEPDPKAAEKHYFEALDLGVPRDSTIEDFLEKSEAAGVSVGMR